MLDMIHWLFDVTGFGWIVVVLFIMLYVLDKVGGRPVSAVIEKAQDYCADYPGIIAAIMDSHNEEYKTERHWVYNNYKEYLFRAIREQGHITWSEMIKAKRRFDYVALYNMMQDLDAYLYDSVDEVFQLEYMSKPLIKYYIKWAAAEKKRKEKDIAV